MKQNSNRPNLDHLDPKMVYTLYTKIILYPNNVKSKISSVVNPKNFRLFVLTFRPDKSLDLIEFLSYPYFFTTNSNTSGKSFKKYKTELKHLKLH